ncbi:TPA: type VI secretion system protein TssL, long form, partial [Klebsiella pneumoniae]|nr:type VI secretion system protein TssL, long form [Klebsiella pneumoniae]
LLNRQSDQAFEGIVALRLPALQTQGQPPTSGVVPPAPLALAELLAPEVAEGLLTVRDQADRSVIILRGDGLFDSGADQIRAPLLPIIARIADAVEAAPGLVLVDGYTDNVPIRSVRFPSNFHLSQARADSVKAVLQERLSQPERVRAQGRADAAPVADNDTAQGRAQNRRVEITIVPLSKEAGQ